MDGEPEFIRDLAVLRARRNLKWSQESTNPARICLTIAEMDLDGLPAFLQPVLEAALRAGETGYADTREQERACGEFLARHHAAEPASVRCTTDVLAGLRALLRESLPPGSRVIVETPVYGDLFPTVAEAGCLPVPVALLHDQSRNQYSHDWNALHEAARKGAAWVVSQPHNPIGRIWEPTETQCAVALAREHDLLLVANEVHLPLGLDGPVRSMFADPSIHEVRAVGLTSASKAFNIPGLKSASLYGSQRSADFLDALPQGVLGRPGILGALATVACYDDGALWLDALRALLRESVNTALAGLSLLPAQVRVARPTATYLLWAHVERSELARFQRALSQCNVQVSPGCGFGGTAYECFFRVNAAAHPEVLARAFHALAEALDPSSARH